VESARQLRSPAILVITRTGFSARLVSSYRPPVPIFAICTDRRTYTQLNATWGVEPLLSVEEEVSYESLTTWGKRELLSRGVCEPGDSVVVTAGYPFHTAGSTNTMRVEAIEQVEATL
jgi:pyruvate kinase